jgi:excisionase family DNA binding protein
MMSTSVTEPWVSVEDVARHLGVAKDSVYRWIDAKGLPAHRIGRLWKFRLTEVDEWVRGGGTVWSAPSASGEREETREG